VVAEVVGVRVLGSRPPLDRLRRRQRRRGHGFRDPAAIAVPWTVFAVVVFVRPAPLRQRQTPSPSPTPPRARLPACAPSRASTRLPSHLKGSANRRVVGVHPSGVASYGDTRATLRHDDGMRHVQSHGRAQRGQSTAGVLAGLAALITAVGGLFLGLYQAGVIGGHRGSGNPVSSTTSSPAGLPSSGANVSPLAASSPSPSPSPAPNPKAVDLCKEGYVWREAGPNDHVCVTPETRQEAAYDNSQASLRRNPTGPYGPDTCVRGYVWREAFPDDHVCVIPATRQRAADDNSQAPYRVAP
jgi:hypothetical protein